jgi:hypothetical protein
MLVRMGDQETRFVDICSTYCQLGTACCTVICAWWFVNTTCESSGSVAWTASRVL